MDKLIQTIKTEVIIKEWSIEDLKQKCFENSEEAQKYYLDTSTVKIKDEEWRKYPYLQDVLNIYVPTHYIGREYHKIKEMEISSFGRVRVKYENNNDKYVILQQDDKIEPGYLKLSKFPGFGYVYRLVAETWLEKTENRNIVHHIINDGYNNKIENLIWVSVEEHATIHSNNNFNQKIV